MRWPSVPKVPGSNPPTTLLICSAQLPVQVALMRYCPVKGGGNGQTIESTVSGAIVRSWLWSTLTRSCPLGYFRSVAARS